MLELLAVYLPALVLFYVWVGYGLLLWVAAKILRPGRRPPVSFAHPPSVTVVLVVRNEEKMIAERLENLLALRYARPLEILVVSDSSTDCTDSIVKSFADRDHRIRLLTASRVGRSGGQLLAMREVTTELVVFTDAEASFAPDFVDRLARRFEDPQVGCVTANLFLKENNSSLGVNLGLYWRYEKLLRRLESDLGLLCHSSGPCMAFRAALFMPFEPIYGDDCVIPLDMALKGYRTVFAEDAIAYDSMPSSREAQLRARIRMTVRNVAGSLRRPELLNPLRYPRVALPLISHRLLRWCTPVFLSWLVLGNLLLAPRGGVYAAAVALELAGAMLGIVGWIADTRGKGHLPVFSQAYALLVANLGFLIGLWRVISGQRVLFERP